MVEPAVLILAFTSCRKPQMELQWKDHMRLCQSYRLKRPLSNRRLKLNRRPDVRQSRKGSTWHRFATKRQNVCLYSEMLHPATAAPRKDSPSSTARCEAGSSGHDAQPWP